MDTIQEIINENKEVIKLHEELAQLQQKLCDSCGINVEGKQESEYITMMSIAQDFAGGVGGIIYICKNCIDHTNNYHPIGEACLMGNECPIEKYEAYKKDRKNRGD